MLTPTAIAAMLLAIAPACKPAQSPERHVTTVDAVPGQSAAPLHAPDSAAPAAIGAGPDSSAAIVRSFLAHRLTAERAAQLLADQADRTGSGLDVEASPQMRPLLDALAREQARRAAAKH
jgi:hypothetical protein